MRFAHTTTREDTDVKLAGRDFTFTWGIHVAKKTWAASREMIVHGAPAESTTLTRRESTEVMTRARTVFPP